MSPAASSVARWVHTWVSAPQLTEPGNLPPAPFTRSGSVLADATLRQTARVTIGGDRLRLRFSNAFGGAALPLTAVTVARPVGNRAGVAVVEPRSVRPVTFHGRAGVVVPVGAQVVSDPLEFPVGPEENVTVTVHLADGQASDLVTSHPGSRTTSHIVAGDHVEADDLPDATTTDHWYFLSGIEVWAERGGSAVVALGDSLTDGRGSTTNGNDRWPDRLSARLRTDSATARVAVLNQGTGGNRVLSEGIGPSALARFDRDVLAQSGVGWLVVFEGINDICTADAKAVVQKQVVDDLCAAYEQLVVRAHAHGITVYGATLAPLGGNEGYDDPDGYREGARQAVNEWIRAGGAFDGVLDFDAAVRDPQDPRRLLAAYDEGDHLHLTPAGYQALADAVSLELFRSS